MPSPKVSIIVTTINRPSLKDAIKSIQDQTFQDWELIIVNDNPKIACSIFQDKRIKVISNSENLGGAKSLNIGLKQAKGKYIAILDDDDEWISKDKLSRQVQFLDENKDYIAIGTEMKGSISPGEVSLVGTPFAHSSIMFRRGTYYNEKLPIGKDLDMMLRLSQQGKMDILRDCFIKYQIRFGRNELRQKIRDCHWHRKVVLLHKEFPDWFSIYMGLLAREMKLRYYTIKNLVRDNL